MSKKEAPSRGRSEAASEDNRRRSDILRDIWKRFVTCLRPDPENDVVDSGRAEEGHEKRDVKKSVWSYRPYDVF